MADIIDSASEIEELQRNTTIKNASSELTRLYPQLIVVGVAIR